jgi:hypothetical protein
LKEDKAKRHWKRITEACRASDWQEALRQARSIVEADPYAIEARQLLAALCLKLGNRRLAQVHYERLLPLAVGKGDLLGALAIQKHLDHLNANAPQHAERFIAMHTWFRSLGGTHTSSTGVPPGGGLTQDDLLKLPREAFSKIAEEAQLEVLEMEPRSVDVQGGSLWIVLYGRVGWWLRHPEGRQTSRKLAMPGDNLYVDPDLGRELRLELAPEMPSECLRFDAELVQELVRTMPNLARSLGTGFVVEERALLPIAPRPPSDLDHASTPPTPPAGGTPRRLALDGEPEGGAERDSGDWLEYGMVDLPTSGAMPGLVRSPLDGDEAPEPGPRSASHEPNLDLSPPAGGASREPRAPRPVTGPPGPVELGQGLVLPPAHDPFAEPRGDVGQPIERRRDPRVAVAVASRLAVLGLSGLGLPSVSGRLTDLSVSGMGVRFTEAELGSLRAALQGAAITVELELRPPEPPLRLAGRVRRLDGDGQGKTVLLGVEFVLATELDRARLLEAVAQAAYRSKPTGSA